MDPPARYGDQTIPEKTIWSFWHGGFANLTPLLHLCVGTWQAQNPEWDIRIIDRHNVHSYAPPAELPQGWEQFESPAHQADAARLAVLKLHGGVYLDISMILMTSLDSFVWDGISKDEYGYFGFYNPAYGVGEDGREAVAPWFMATRKNSPFVSRWHEVFCQVLHGRRNVTRLSEHPMLKGICLDHLKEFKDYLAMNSVMKYLIDLEPEMKAYWQNRSLLLNTNDTGYKWRFVLGVDEWYTDHEMEGLVGPNHREADWNALKDVPLIKLNNAGGALNKCDYPELLNGNNLVSRIFSKALMRGEHSQTASAPSA